MTIPTRKAVLLVNGGAYNGNITTQACNHPYLVVFVHSSYGAGAPVPSSVTFNGKGMSHIGDKINGIRAVSIWGIVPDIGTYNLTVTIGTTTACYTTAVQYQNVAQNPAYSGFASSSGTGGTLAVSITGTVNAIGVMALTISGTRTISFGAGETSIGGTFGGGITSAASDKLGATSISFSDTSNTGDDWAMVGVVLQPAGSVLQEMIY